MRGCEFLVPVARGIKQPLDGQVQLTYELGVGAGVAKCLPVMPHLRAMAGCNPAAISARLLVRLPRRFLQRGLAPGFVQDNLASHPAARPARGTVRLNLAPTRAPRNAATPQGQPFAA